MEKELKILEEQVEAFKEYVRKCEKYPEFILHSSTVEFGEALEKFINRYRTLEDQVEELKNLANNTQWISPCYVAENYIAKEKVDEKIEELDEKIKYEHNEY